jgi:hypothetical protein
MQKIVRTVACGLVLLSSLSSLSCGGGGSSAGTSGSGTVAAATAPNVLSVIVDTGPNGSSVNTLFATITVCVPGSTTECQTIDHIQVDTGSNGLRILAPVLTLNLPVTAASDGNSLVECTQFVDGYSWGPVSLADVKVSGEAASSVPIQVIGASNVPAVPSTCSSMGATAEDTVAAFGANGILGIGVFEQDCGATCTAPLNGFYYSCTATVCSDNIGVPLTSQVLNPVTQFAADNNGSIIELPAVALDGAASVTGSLIFGIDTLANNASGAETVLALDGSGDFTTTLNGVGYQSFIDSGTNGTYFDDNDGDSDLTACTASGFTSFYCPASTQTFTAVLSGTSGTSATATFSVGNAQTLLTASDTAFPTLAGTYSTSTTNTATFDWGLPFYYGRRVATAIENHSTSLATGPYMAF